MKTIMISRERVSLALAHQEPDRAPIDYWATGEINKKLLRHFGIATQEQLLNRFCLLRLPLGLRCWHGLKTTPVI